MTHQRGNAAHHRFCNNVSKVGQNRNPKQKQKKNPKLHFLLWCRNFRLTFCLGRYFSLVEYTFEGR